MAWWDNLGQVISTALSNPATAQLGSDMLSALGNQSKQNAQINNLLVQVLTNPDSAGMVAAQITAMPGVPAQVSGMVNALPTVAKDHMQLTLLVAQIQAALPHSSMFGG